MLEFHFHVRIFFFSSKNSHVSKNILFNELGIKKNNGLGLGTKYKLIFAISL